MGGSPPGSVLSSSVWPCANTFPHWAFVSSLEDDLGKVRMHSLCTCAFISIMFSLDSISATPPVPDAESGDGKDKGRRMLARVAFSTSAWQRLGSGHQASGRGLDSPPKVAAREIGAGCESFGFHGKPGPCHVVAGRTPSTIGGAAPRGECLGGGGEARAVSLGCKSPSELHPQGPGPRGAPISPCWGGAELPRGDTHRTPVLLQRHQLAPDVDGLEVVEVLLPRSAGRGRQEQPRCHQCSHHDSLPRWPICQGKDEAGGVCMCVGGRRGRLWDGGREEAAPASPGQRRRTRPFLFLLSRRWSASHWTSVSPSLLQEPFDSAPLPGPHSQGSRILITDTRI